MLENINNQRFYAVDIVRTAKQPIDFEDEEL